MTAVNYSPPAGICVDQVWARSSATFRIGDQQTWARRPRRTRPGTFITTDSTRFAGTWSQSARLHLQHRRRRRSSNASRRRSIRADCPSSIGQWLSSGTFCRPTATRRPSTGRVGSLMGYVGGQSLAFSAGSGYTNGTYTLDRLVLRPGARFHRAEGRCGGRAAVDCRCLPVGQVTTAATLATASPRPARSR